MRKSIVVLLIAVITIGCDAEREIRIAGGILQDVRNPGCAVLPDVSDWEYWGTAVEPGRDGDFDYYLWGGFGGAAIRFGGEVLLYYQGASGYSDIQESVSFRTIGLATSIDLSSFRKDPASPILEWTPNGGEEEGVASMAVSVGPDGQVHAFYGANTQTGPTTVSADGRWARRPHGARPTPRGQGVHRARGAGPGRRRSDRL